MEKIKKNAKKEKMIISKEEWQELKRKEKILEKALQIFRVEAKDLPRIIERFQREVKEMEEKLNL